jgi:hypothetical protein
MKRILLYLLPAILVVVATGNSSAQSLAPDQNPNYAASRDKYVRMADSINAWHGTTPQETYRAIDYLEDKRIAKQERIAFRRELRLARARNGWSNYYDDGYYYNGGGYNRPYYNSYPYYGGRRGYYRNAAWNVLPWVIGAGLWWR